VIPPKFPWAGGLPHSEIPGSPIARISPGLFAACHVLHRLSVPRHPPDALTSRLIPAEPKVPPHTTAAHRAKTPNARRSHMKTLLRICSALAARAYPPRSHHNSLSSPFNQHPARLPGRCLLIFSERRTPPVRHTSGGGERDRTDDLLLAKQALSQLSYTPFLREWWAREDLNLRPHAYQARALTS
jgi:hypothetical protein